MIYRKIWVPSQQKYLRFQELSCEQYKQIHQTIDDDDFSFVLNRILINNHYGDIDITKISTIDRFVIFLYLKIYSCGKTLSITRTCDKCQTPTKKDFDLNGMLDVLAPVIDRNFETEFPVSIDQGSYSLVCDIPPISHDELFEYDSISEDIDNYLFTYLKKIKVNATGSEYDLMIGRDRNRVVYSNIPYKTMMQIKNEFIEPIHKDFMSILMMDIKCSNTKCGDEWKLNFVASNLADMIKIVYRDDSLENILSIMSNISGQCHFDYNFYKNLTPLELDIILSSLRRNNSEAPPVLPTNEENDTDLFEQYREQTKGMVETTSEFK